MAKERDFLDEMVSPATDTASEASEAEGEATEATRAAEEAPEQEHEAGEGDNETEEVEAASPAATPESEGHRVPYAAMKAEREKRQREEAARKAAETRAQELERQLAELRNPKADTAAEATRPARDAPDFYTDPEGYVHAVVSTVEQRATDRLYVALEEAERERHTDYDEVSDVAIKAAEQDPRVRERILKARNPAAEAYKVGKSLRENELRLTDPEAYREQVRKELLAELEAKEAERLAKEDAERELESSIPPNLAARRSTAGKPATPRKPKTVLDEVFPKT